jgi:putative SOS response-associated peptidase YedK
MCGRFTLRIDGELVSIEWGWTKRLPTHPRFNIAPTQPIWAVRYEDGEARPVELRWGLIPAWAKDPSIGNRMINARAETLLEKPAFRQAFAKRRCLVLADGFYEWQGTGKGPKQPFWFRRADGGLLTFAGLWDQWVSPDGEPVETCTIITTSCNETLRPVHARMPAIIAPADRPAWLDCANPVSAVASMLVPAPDDLLVATPVSAAVNSPTNDGPALIEEALIGANDSPELELL